MIRQGRRGHHHGRGAYTALYRVKNDRASPSTREGEKVRERAAHERSALSEMTPGTRRTARLAGTMLTIAGVGATIAHLGGAVDLGAGSAAGPLSTIAGVWALIVLRPR